MFEFIQLYLNINITFWITMRIRTNDAYEVNNFDKVNTKYVGKYMPLLCCRIEPDLSTFPLYYCHHIKFKDLEKSPVLHFSSMLSKMDFHHKTTILAQGILGVCLFFTRLERTLISFKRQGHLSVAVLQSWFRDPGVCCAVLIFLMCFFKNCKYECATEEIIHFQLNTNIMDNPAFQWRWKRTTVYNFL